VTRSSEHERPIVDLRAVEAPVDEQEQAVPAHIWDRLVDDGDVSDPDLVRLIHDRFRPASVAGVGRAAGRGTDRAGGVATATRPATQDDVVRLKVEALSRLAAALQEDGRQGDAEGLLRRSLVLAEVAYGAEAAEAAGLRLVLAAALISQGKVDEAQPYIDRAVTSLEAVAFDPSAVAASAYQLAKFLAGRGKVDQAIALYEHTVAIRRKVLGPEHPEVAITLHNLALLYNAAGRVEEANSMWAEARALLDG
jgi:tetratricopeptide (TPR) repeat protein